MSETATLYYFFAGKASSLQSEKPAGLHLVRFVSKYQTQIEKSTNILRAYPIKLSIS
jgi:hypothetical protein